MSEKVSNEEYRMMLQLETSLLGWLRTSLALMGFGFVIARFGLFLRELAQANDLVVHAHPWLTHVNTWTGTALIALGIIVLLISTRNHQITVDRLHRGVDRQRHPHGGHDQADKDAEGLPRRGVRISPRRLSGHAPAEP